MISRRLSVAAAAALALLVWVAWPSAERARRDGATATRHARPAPSASARRAAPVASQDPAEPRFGARSTGIPACDDIVARTMACSQLPDDAKIAIAEASKGWAESGERAALEASCRATASVQDETLAAMGC